jgi:hypothetical protein
MRSQPLSLSVQRFTSYNLSTFNHTYYLLVFVTIIITLLTYDNKLKKSSIQVIVKV